MLIVRRIFNSLILVLLSSVILGLNSAGADGFSMSINPNSATNTNVVEPWFMTVLSEHAIPLIGQKAIKHGPNCFNAALVGSGVLEHVRHTSSDEMLSLLKSPICEKILPGELKAGDLRVFIRQLEGLDESNSLAHANNWLSEGFSFNKMSLYAGSGYEVIANQAVLEKYQYFSEVLMFNQIQPDGTNKQIQCKHGIQCENKIEYYRCDQSISDYIFKNTKNEILLNIYKKIKIVEKNVEQLVFSKDKTPLFLIEETKNLKLKLLSTTVISNNDIIISDYLEQALDSILKQYTY